MLRTTCFSVVATFAYSVSASVWEYGQTFSAANGHAFDNFGVAVAVDGDVAVVGAPGDDWNGHYTGSAYVYRRVNQTWELEVRLRLPDGEALDQFGSAVDVSGAHIAVSAVGDDSGRGAVYVFEHIDAEWRLADKLTERPRLREPGDQFGFDVDLAGGLLAVSVPYDLEAPAVHLFRFGNGWSRDDVVVSPSTNPYDLFGWSVSLSDEQGLFVGAPSAVFGSSRGAVYVFSHTSRWKHSATLTPDRESWYGFGFDVSADGDTVAAGSDDNFVCVFEHSGVWSQSAELTAGDGYSRFGNALHLSNAALVVGAPLANDAGAAYVFSRQFGGWANVDVLTPPDGLPMDFFGIAVSLSGCDAFVGNFPDRDDAMGGSAYVFRAVKCAYAVEQ